MTEAEMTALRAKFVAALRAHDWSYQYADDHTAYHAGKESLEALHKMRAQLPDSTALWNAYAPVGHKLVT